MQLGLSEASSKRPRAQRSWDIYCQLKDRINAGVIKPVRPVYDRSGELDFTRTSIETAELGQLALKRREIPKYLRHLQIDGSPIRLVIEKAKLRDLAKKKSRKHGRELIPAWLGETPKTQKGVSNRRRKIRGAAQAKLKTQRGPAPGTTGFLSQDRKVFPKIAKKIKKGEARSPYSAAMQLKDEIAGSASPENKAKRVSARYREWLRKNSLKLPETC